MNSSTAVVSSRLDPRGPSESSSLCGPACARGTERRHDGWGKEFAFLKRLIDTQRCSAFPVYSSRIPPAARPPACVCVCADGHGELPRRSVCGFLSAPCGWGEGTGRGESVIAKSCVNEGHPARRRFKMAHITPRRTVYCCNFLAALIVLNICNERPTRGGVGCFSPSPPGGSIFTAGLHPPLVIYEPVLSQGLYQGPVLHKQHSPPSVWLQ